jgi:phage/plasmid-like protein (TIGR03299 family)
MFNMKSPWEKIGENITGSPSVEAALKKSNLDWKVKPRPLFVDGREVLGYKANIREDNTQVMGIVTDQYQIIQNEDAFNFVDSMIGNNGFELLKAGVVKGGKKFFMISRLNEQIILDDVVSPYLIFSNGFDGALSLKAAITPLRNICSNALNFAFKHAARSWAIKHVGDVKNKLKQAKYTMLNTELYMHELKKSSEELANKSMSYAEFNDFTEALYPLPTVQVTNKKLDNVNQLRSSLKKAYDQPDIAKYRNTKYGVINAVSDAVTHAEPLRKTSDENMFNQVIDGHKTIDKAMMLLQSIMLPVGTSLNAFDNNEME